jgi:2-polyprenyl-3-methyl-5-hydroxy-6-metoxy-1,4-benzoquinol methylase
MDKFDDLYRNIYRSEYFRGKTIEKAFEEILNNPCSENQARLQWFQAHNNITNKVRVLDIGSGIGVWPQALDMFCQVWFDEINKDSIRFIRDVLYIPKHSDGARYDYVTLIHFLEHMEDPKKYLLELKTNRLNSRGSIFIEVPDSEEFDYLPEDHDEFNSCHLWFFDVRSLTRLVEESGYRVRHLSRIRTHERNLSRIMMVADVR